MQSQGYDLWDYEDIVRWFTWLEFCTGVTGSSDGTGQEDSERKLLFMLKSSWSAWNSASGQAEPAESLWFKISRQTNMGVIVVGICYRGPSDGGHRKGQGALYHLLLSHYL